MWRTNVDLLPRNAHFKIFEQKRVDGIYTMISLPRYSNEALLVFTPEDQEILKQIKRD